MISTSIGPWARTLRLAGAPPGVGAVSPVLEDWSSGGRGYGLRFVDVKTNVAWLDGASSRLPYAGPVLPGFFLAVPRRVFVALGGFDASYAHWGMEDLDLVVRLWSLGYECLLHPGVVVRQLSGPGPARRVFAARPPTKHPSPATDAFLELLLDVAGRHAQQ